MSAGDFRIKNTPANGVAFGYRRIVASGTTASINVGEPTKEGSSGAVAIMADGEGTTSQRFSGLSKSVSTETASVAGEVYVYIPFPGIIYDGRPKTAGNANTQAKIDALMGKRVVFDLTSGAWTIDTAAADAIGNGVVIVGGDPLADRVHFCVTHTTIQFFEDN